MSSTFDISAPKTLITPDTPVIPMPIPMPMSRLLEVLSIIPNEDLHRTWVADIDIDITIMLRMTSKKVIELIKKLRLPAIVSLKRLTSCRFSENLPLIIMHQLINFSCNNNIKILKIQFFRIKEIIDEFSKLLEKCYDLTELDLSDGGLYGVSLTNAINISPVQSKSLVIALNKSFTTTSTTLRSLNLQNCNICNNEIKKLNLDMLINLTSLNLGGNKISYNGPETFADITTKLTSCTGSGSRALAYLNLENNNITNDCIESLSNFSTLTRLDLSMNCINFYNAESLLKKFLECTALVHLDLSYNWIKSEGGGKFAGILEQLPSLKHLDLSYNSIKIDGAVIIATESKKCTSLSHLDLRHNFIRLDLWDENIGKILENNKNNKCVFLYK
jgi:hypothetical protein